MRRECLELIKEIGRYDLIIGGMVAFALIPLVGGGTALYCLGIACSFINFIINSCANNRLCSIKNIFDALLFVAAYTVRIGIISSIAILLIIRRDLFFYIFIAGYSTQVISIVVYGLKLKIKEGM